TELSRSAQSRDGDSIDEAVVEPADPPASSPLFELLGVALRLSGRPILENIDLVVKRGEFVSVVGSSGCGKTSLLRLMAGLMRPSSGEVRYEGVPVAAPRQDVAIVFQDYGKALLPWRTAADNVSLALEAQRTPKSERRDRIFRALDLVGLTQHFDKFPNQLSG